MKRNKKEGRRSKQCPPNSSLTSLQIAEHLRNYNLSVIPVKVDGSKAPPFPWVRFKEELPTKLDLEQQFGALRLGIAIICGVISGGLEVFDFDGEAERIFPLWKTKIQHLFDKYCLIVVRTPSGGFHVYFRCSEISKSNKIACDPEAEKKVLIETRGEGAYIIAPGSPPATHSTGKLYELIKGDFSQIPRITPEEREQLWFAAMEFDRRKPRERKSVRGLDQRQRVAGIKTPWGDFDHNEDWAAILEPHEWHSSDGIHWTRPGKGDGCSAKIYSCDDGLERLTVFTTSMLELEEGCYTKSVAYAALNHDGDFSASAKSLRKKGWGCNNA